MAPFSVLGGNGLITAEQAEHAENGLQGIGFRAPTNQVPESMHVEKWNEESHRKAFGLLSINIGCE